MTTSIHRNGLFIAPSFPSTQNGISKKSIDRFKIPLIQLIKRQRSRPRERPPNIIGRHKSSLVILASSVPRKGKLGLAPWSQGVQSPVVRNRDKLQDDKKLQPRRLLMLLLAAFFATGDCYIHRRHKHYNFGSRVPSIPPPVPQFDHGHSRDVTALSGQTAVLNCRVHNASNKTVSWIRHQDLHLLTAGHYTYTSDLRFRALHTRDSDDWSLRINYAQTKDSGIYECQVSTTPPMSHFVALNVVQPLTHILGGPDLHINRGSTINLTCVVQYSPEPPDFIYWNHEERIISYDSERGGVTVILEKGKVTTSSLLIQGAGPRDSGMYECHPSNSAGATVAVHVLDGGEHPAAIQRGGHGAYPACVRVTLATLLLLSLCQEELL